VTATPKGHRSRAGGRFAEEATPPAKPVLVYLPEPLLERLDAYGRTTGPALKWDYGSQGRNTPVQRVRTHAALE